MEKFTDSQISQLSHPLDKAKVCERPGPGGRKLSYVESWDAIDSANRIFGFDGWSRELISRELVNCTEAVSGDNKTKVWSVSYIATVRVTVSGCVREGTGGGHGEDRKLGMAHESAIKEAESDATKRALMTFGYQFGLALYDKQQRHVSSVDPRFADKTLATEQAMTQLYAKLGEYLTAEESHAIGEKKLTSGEARLLYSIAGSCTIEDGEKMYCDPTTGELFTQSQFAELVREKTNVSS